MKFFKKLRTISMMICSVIYLLLGISPIQAYAKAKDIYFGEYTWPNIPGDNTDKALDQWHLTGPDDDGYYSNEQVNSTGNWGKWIWSKASVTTEGNKTIVIIEDLQLKQAYAVSNNFDDGHYIFVFPGVKEVYTRHNTWGADTDDIKITTLQNRGFKTSKERDAEKYRLAHLNSSNFDGSWYSETEYYNKLGYLKVFSTCNGRNVSQDTHYKYNHFARRVSLKLVYENLKEIPRISASSFGTYDKPEGTSGPTVQGTTIRTQARSGIAHYIIAENEAISSITGTQGFTSTVKFNANGGSVSETTRTVAAGAAIGNLPAATRAHHTLKGWFTAASGGTKIDANTKVSGDTTYYAQWNPNNYTITYDANGGTVSPASVTMAYRTGAQITNLPTPARAGYKFNGWYTAKTGGTRITKIDIDGNKTVYAQWTPITYTITYKLNGGKVDYKKVKYNIETPTFYIENPTKKGYNFIGWTGTDIDTATTDLSVPLGSYGDKTFEANWGDGIYAISFDGNGATSGSMETLTVKAGESIKLPENSFVRDGYSFVGWYTTKEDRFGTFYRNGATITDLTESVTLHAQWKKGNPSDSGNNGGNGGNGDSGNGNGGDNGSGNSGDNGNGGNNGDNGSGNSGDNGGNNGDGDNGNNNNSHNITPKDELGYFGTAQRRNEISIRTTLGMQDKKLTLNYNY